MLHQTVNKFEINDHPCFGYEEMSNRARYWDDKRFHCDLVSLVLDGCASITCQHKGTCFHTVSGPICQCVSGYKGSRCEEGKVIITKINPSDLHCNYYCNICVNTTTLVCAFVFLFTEVKI